MKCEKCKEKEANLFYKVMINAETTEVHLCSDCAQETGFMAALNWQQRGMIDAFLSAPCGMPDDFLGREMFPGFGRKLVIPVLALPKIEIQDGGESEGAERAAMKTEANIPEDAGAELKAKRALLSLKHQLHEAVKSENFEKALELRDKIREIEKP